MALEFSQIQCINLLPPTIHGNGQRDLKFTSGRKKKEKKERNFPRLILQKFMT